MKLSTVRLADGRTTAARMEGDDVIELAATDIGALLALPNWKAVAAASGSRHDVGEVHFAPVVPRPEKIVCVGLNYRDHILEMGRDLPKYPTLFAKYWRSLVGADNEIELPHGSQEVDWEAELAVVVQSSIRHASRGQATDAIAGYTIANDVTARDFQNRTVQWLQGKTFEHSTPLGPWLVTDIDHVELGSITCKVDGQVVQSADVSDLVFDPADLVAYVSTIVTLAPGDVILTGTPGGVGHGRTPPCYLADGSVVVTAIEGIGEMINICRKRDPGHER